MTHFFERIFELPNWLALALVFLLPALEASVFLGFVVPGEIAVIIGGVLAFQGRLSLVAVLVAAIGGAVIGDSVGYVVGSKWGRRILDSTIGRFVKAAHIDKGEAFLGRRGGSAVFLGRWTASLRAIVPGLAGMSNLHYRTFVIWNVLGGTLWAGTFVLLGYFAGDSWRRMESSANMVGYVALGVFLVGALVAWLVHKRRAHRSNPAETETSMESEEG